MIIKNSRNKSLSRSFYSLTVIMVAYSLLGVMSIFWAFNLSEYSVLDFLIMYSIILAVQTAAIFKMVYNLTGNKMLFYLLAVYSLILISFISSIALAYLINIGSFLVILILFLHLNYRSSVSRKFVYAGISYSLISIISQTLLLIGRGDAYIYSLVSIFIFLIALFFLSRETGTLTETRIASKKIKTDGLAIKVIKYFVFLVVMSNLVFIGTIGAHEFGHFAISKLYGCSHRGIVYESGLPHTEVLCQNIQNTFFILVGGSALPIIISILLLVIGGTFLKEIALLMMGFNFIIANKDLLDLGMSYNLVVFLFVGGAILAIAGLIALAKSRAEGFFLENNEYE